MTTLVNLIIVTGIILDIQVIKKLSLYLDIASVQLHTTPKAILKKIIGKA